MAAFRLKFIGVGVAVAQYASCKGDCGYLHSQTDTQIRYIVLSGIGGCPYFSFNSARTKASRYQNAAAILQQLSDTAFRNIL